MDGCGGVGSGGATADYRTGANVGDQPTEDADTDCNEQRGDVGRRAAIVHGFQGTRVLT